MIPARDGIIPTPRSPAPGPARARGGWMIRAPLEHRLMTTTSRVMTLVVDARAAKLAPGGLTAHA